MLNESYTLGILTESQQTAILTLLYKKGDHRYLKNWRPLSLLSVDYKILTKAIANRIYRVLNIIIGKGQTCGVQNRSIFDSIYLVQGTVNYLSQQGNNGAIICIDQEKAFDRIDREWIIKVMENMNFGPDILRWIQILYKSTKSKIQINGSLTDTLDIASGVRQGCPLSMLLYTIAAEPLATYINNNPQIRGITLPSGNTIKISQYADDTTAFISDTYSYTILQNAFKLFENASASKQNKNKTEILLLGNLKQEDFITNNVNITNNIFKTQINVLGIIIGNDCSWSNWNRVIDTIKRYFSYYKSRHLSFRGKQLIADTYILSKVWYLARVFELPKAILTQINKEYFNFIWDNRCEAISRDVMCLPYIRGGQNMTNIKNKCDALLLQKIKLLINKPLWYPLGVYWLGITLRNTHPDLAANSLQHTLHYHKHDSTTPYTKTLIRNIESRNSKIALNKFKVKDYTRELSNTVHVNSLNHVQNKTKSLKLIHNRFVDNKYKDSNFLILHKRLFIGKRLLDKNIFNNNLVNNGNCLMCGVESESFEHLFFECTYVKPLLIIVKDVTHSIFAKDITLNFNNIIDPGLLSCENYLLSTVNLFISMYKFCIWKYRCYILSEILNGNNVVPNNNILIASLHKHIKERYEIDKVRLGPNLHHYWGDFDPM